MRKILLMTACASLLAASGCDNMSRHDQDMVIGGLAGATIGILTAKALNADDDWVIIAGLAGATVGTLVARNQKTNECAYARADGTYRIVRC
ncbi:MAG: glucose-6-phosphate isomerase [Paracoccaceae bacterium]